MEIKQLHDTKEDREYLEDILDRDRSVIGIVTLYGFTSELASSLTGVEYHAEITGIDIKSGYCSWTERRSGKKMPTVNIGVIRIFK